MTGPEESHSSTRRYRSLSCWRGTERSSTAGWRAPTAPSRQHRSRHGRRTDRRDADHLRRHPQRHRRASHRRARRGPRRLHRADVQQWSDRSRRGRPGSRRGSREVGEEAAPTDEEALITPRTSSSATTSLCSLSRPRGRPHYAHALRRYPASSGVGAEQMSPDPARYRRR